MNPKNCKLTGIHEPLLCKNGIYQCRWCHYQVSVIGELIQKPKIEFNKDETYKKILEFYISKNYTKEHANEIAQKIVEEQMRIKS